MSVSTMQFVTHESRPAVGLTTLPSTCERVGGRVLDEHLVQVGGHSVGDSAFEKRRKAYQRHRHCLQLAEDVAIPVSVFRRRMR